MRLEIRKDFMSIIPETGLDEVYIERVLNLVRNGDSIPLKRQNRSSMDNELWRLVVTIPGKETPW